MKPDQSLVEQIISSPDGKWERTVWTWDAAGGEAKTALLFLDAEVYLMGVHGLGVVQRLCGHRILPPILAAFVSHKDSAARHVDYTCNAEFAAYIVENVVGHIRKGNPAVNDFVIIGLSLSGLAAADIAVRYPRIFRAAICQSPSMWWKAGRFQTQIPIASRPDQEFWISVGDRETDAGTSHPPTGLFQGTSQLDACEQAAAALRAKGYSTTFRTYDGGHDPNCWREDLAMALPWAYRRS